MSRIGQVTKFQHASHMLFKLVNNAQSKNHPVRIKVSIFFVCVRAHAQNSQNVLKTKRQLAMKEKNHISNKLILDSLKFIRIWSPGPVRSCLLSAQCLVLSAQKMRKEQREVKSASQPVSQPASQPASQHKTYNFKTQPLTRPITILGLP